VGGNIPPDGKHNPMETLIPPAPTHGQPAEHPKREPSTPDAISVHQVLEEVLASPPFCHTLQCQNLLRYIVKHTLAQEDHLLRERVIGAEVFGRRPDYETGDDPVVRIRAAEVRKRLAQFYQSVAGSAHAPEVHIDIPSGSYRACFRWRDTARTSHETSHLATRELQSLATADLSPISIPATDLQPPLPPQTLAMIADASPNRKLAKRLAVLAVMMLAVAGWFLYAFAGSLQKRAFREFWQPFTSSSKPVIIAIGSNAVYRLSPQLTDRYAHDHDLETEGMEFFMPIDPSSSISGSDVEPAMNSFVALGDVAAVSEVVAALTARGQAFQERFPNDISFAELRNSPTVLVGGFNNPMTIELTKHLPFVLHARNEIEDTGPSGRRWMLHASSDSHDTEDYAIITRLAQKNDNAPVISVAGMGQYGTLAAAGFVCSPASIAQLVRQLPKGWENHNLQVVLHIRVVDFKPAATDVVAVRTW
jgi:hypothetical protein